MALAGSLALLEWAEESPAQRPGLCLSSLAGTVYLQMQHQSACKQATRQSGMGGDGFIIHDNGEAKATAWAHGRDAAIATRYLNDQALRYGLKLEEGRLSLTVETADWLTSAILAVANAAATAAGQAVEHVARSAMLVLQDAIEETLVSRFARSRVTPKPTRVGASGRPYQFDFAVSDAGHVVLIDAVTPYANSINSKYTAFSDVGSLLEKRGLVVFDKPLEASDKTLLSEVADVVPLKSLTERIVNELPSLAV